MYVSSFSNKKVPLCYHWFGCNHFLLFHPSNFKIKMINLTLCVSTVQLFYIQGLHFKMGKAKGTTTHQKIGWDEMRGPS